MNKKEFLLDLEEIIDDSIFIGKTSSDLSQETSQNTWFISMDSLLKKSLPFRN